MKIELILFDFYGTLAFLAKRPSFQDLFHLLEKTGLKLEMATEIADSFLSASFWSQDFKSWEDFVRAVLSQWDKKPEGKLVQEIASFLKKNVAFKFYEDARNIDKLSIRKAILTTAPRFLLTGLSFEGFEKIFTPENTKALKPDPKAFLTAIKDLGVLPGETLMVGDDLESDIIPAKKLGIKVTLIDRDNSVKNSPVKKINSLKELKNLLV